MNKPEILIIDDEPQIRKLLQINLESNDYKVNQAVDGKSGVLTAANHPPDLILLDIGLPDESGLMILKKLREWFNKPIIILSVQNNEEVIVAALDGGATDYICKPFRVGELLARIRAAIKRDNSVLNSSIIQSENLEIDLVNRQVKLNDLYIKLTATEFNLLALFVKNEDKVLTHSYILNEVWGPGYRQETQYLRVFIGNLRKKIENNPNHPTRIMTESRIGYRFC